VIINAFTLVSSIAWLNFLPHEWKTPSSTIQSDHAIHKVIRCIAKSPRTSLKEDSEDHLFNDKLDQANILDLMQKHVKLSKLLNMVLGDWDPKLVFQMSIEHAKIFTFDLAKSSCVKIKPHKLENLLSTLKKKKETTQVCTWLVKGDFDPEVGEFVNGMTLTRELCRKTYVNVQTILFNMDFVCFYMAAAKYYRPLLLR